MLLSGLCRRCTSIVSIPKQWRYKDVNPSSTPLSLRSRSFFLVLIKTFDHNLGQGNSQLIWLCILFRENRSAHLFYKGFNHKHSSAHIKEVLEMPIKSQ